MQQFTIKKNSFRELRNKLAIIMIFGNVIAFSIVHYLSDGRDTSGPFTSILLTALLWFTMYRSQKRMFESFRLTINEDAVIREQHNTPTITLPKNSIREITRTPGGIFRITGESKLNAIGIPAQIENADELQHALSEIKPVITKSNWTPMVFLQLGALFFVIIGGGMGLLSEDRIVFTISGIAICALLAYGFIITHGSKNFDNRMKRMSYIIIIPFVSILAYVALQWLGI